MMNDLLEVSVHIELFTEIHTEYYRRSALNCQDDIECEELYTLLERDIRMYPSPYFDVIFTLDDIYSERCVGILCSLANIFRHKHQWNKCSNVLQLAYPILRIYQQRCGHPITTAADEASSSSSSSGEALAAHHRPSFHRRRRIQRSQQLVRVCSNLTYKFNDLCIDANSHLYRKVLAVRALRDVCQHELDQQWTFEQQKWLVVLFGIVGPDYKLMTKQDLAELDDSSLWEALLHRIQTTTAATTTTTTNNTSKTAAFDYDNKDDETSCNHDDGVVVVDGSNNYAYDVEFQKCNGCNRIERTRGEFEDCSNCFRVVYCGLECQQRHWKSHKRFCRRYLGSLSGGCCSINNKNRNKKTDNGSSFSSSSCVDSGVVIVKKCKSGGVAAKRCLGKSLASAKSFVKKNQELFECSLPTDWG